MKKNIIRSAKQIIMLLLLFSVAYSCSDDSLSEFEIRKIIEEEIRKNNQDLEFTQWEIVPITVKETDWEWFDNEKRYEAVYDLPELTEFIYEHGAQIGYVFIGDQGVNEVQKMLPFVKSYGSGVGSYTETISCDYQLGSPSTVAFYMQASDLKEHEEFLGDYNFRIVLVW